MVSATKMRKSQEVALRARPFAKKTLSLMQDIVEHEEVSKQESIYFAQQKEGLTCLIVVTSDKGLCGSFNSQVLRLAFQWKGENPEADIIAVGRKGRDFFKRRGVAPVAEFLQFSDIVSLHDIALLSEWVLKAFEERRYKRIVIVSTQFFSTLVQKPNIRQLLPLSIAELQEAVESIVPKTGKYADWSTEESGKEKSPLHLLEPSPEAVLEILLRDLLKVQILHYIFESNASEHSSRMIAMKNATENAENMMETLKLVLNKSRQASITQELTEISTAKEALSAE